MYMCIFNTLLSFLDTVAGEICPPQATLVVNVYIHTLNTLSAFLGTVAGEISPPPTNNYLGQSNWCTYLEYSVSSLRYSGRGVCGHQFRELLSKVTHIQFIPYLRLKWWRYSLLTEIVPVYALCTYLMKRRLVLSWTSLQSWQLWRKYSKGDCVGDQSWTLLIEINQYLGLTLKKGWTLISFAPVAPRRFFGSFCKSFWSKSLTQGLRSDGIGALLCRIRLEKG